MKHTITAILLGLGLCALADTPTITNVTARQRYPWNGKVDITCTVAGIERTTKRQEFAVSAVDPDSGNVRGVSHVKVLRDGAESDDLSIFANGVHRLVWDAAEDLGEVNRSNMVVRVIATDKVQLWEDGPYWAKMNVGAEAPEEYGLYFWWGDTVGYRREGNAWVASDGSSQNFSFAPDNTPTHGKSVDQLRYEGWVTTKDGKNVLTPTHDAAQVQWGGSWRMPTCQELYDLCQMCDWTWTNRNGVNGYLVRGRNDYASASIFLPAAGSGGSSLDEAGQCGYYWSSVPDSAWGQALVYYVPFPARYLFFESDRHTTSYYDVYRYFGFSVRPVQGFTE